MNKIFTVGLALAITTTSAYATKARISALGEGIEDNYFIEDSRSMFTNAAYVNDYANMLTLEWGGTASASGGALDTDASPKAMGGFLRKSGDNVYGAYLGNESNVSSFLRLIASDGTNNTQLAPADNQIDIFYGGKARSFDWGASFIYAKGEDKNATTKSEDKGMALRLGAKTNKWNAYLAIPYGSESTKDVVANTTDPKFEGSFGAQLGGAYLMGNGKLHATYKQFDWDQTLSGVKTEAGFTRYEAGYGVTHQVNTTDMVFARTYYSKLEVEINYTGAPATLDVTKIPVIIGYEAKANSWLTLRGSIIHDIKNTVEEKNLAQFVGTSGVKALQTAALSAYGATGTDGEVSDGKTTIRAGATLTFGNLDIDGFIGLGNTAASVDKDKNTGSLNLDTALTRVGMTYKF